MESKMESKQPSIPVIICGGATGRCVVYGYVDKMPDVGEQVKIRKARMVLRWATAGLFDLAANGPRNDTRLTVVVDEVIDTCRQVMTVTPISADALDAWKVFK